MNKPDRSTTEYNPVAKGLHWLIAIGLLGAFALGSIMTDIPGITPTKLKYYNWHKWLGVTLLALSLARIAWRVLNPPPPLPAHMSRLQVLLSKAMHHSLYLATLAIPVLGYLYTLAAGFPVVYFGVIELPVLFGKTPAWIEPLKQAHSLSADLLLVAVGAHVAAALWHHFRDHDGLLFRMLPRAFSKLGGRASH